MNSNTRRPSDLHAADARYHDKCRKLFMNPQNIRKTDQNNSKVLEDIVFERVVNTINSDPN